jgi:hypothetical protein
VNNLKAFFLALLLTGCQTINETPFLFSSVDRIKLGMSKTEVVEIMGKPRADVVRYDGTESLVWSFRERGRQNTVSFILLSNAVISVPARVARTKEELAIDLVRPREEPKAITPAVPDPPLPDPPPPEPTKPEPTFFTNSAGKVLLNVSSVRNREEYLDAHPEFSLEDKQNIREQRIWIGMTSEQAFVSWGRPEKKNISTYAFGTHEQWVYGSGAYLYFINGVLKSWQKSE